jgi:Na+-transporting NADH:ubiquinone oxidoreductase subunit C
VSEPNNARKQNTYTLLFMVVLSLVCAIILSVLASALRVPQEMARELDRSKQMLIAARILSPFGYFQVQDKEGDYVPAKFTQGGILEPADKQLIPSQDQILEVYRTRIQGFLVNDQGEPTTFQKAGLDEEKYVQDFRKTGYYKEPLKLIYKVFANPKPGEQTNDEKRQVVGYVIPVNGMGLWDAIYGYLAIETNGNSVIGISWYDQKETPGLGANIAEPEWQSQFPGKHIFQESANGQTDFNTAPLGITVVKGKVKEVLANSPKALSAVDGMAGATLTGNGVTNAYRDVLAAYRPFLISLHKQYEKTEKSK